MVAAPIRLGRLRLDWERRTYVIGILNVTPDSFSGDGVTDLAAARARAREMVDAGADIIGVGRRAHARVGHDARHGADAIRVHDVKAMVRVARMTDAIVR